MWFWYVIPKSRISYIVKERDQHQQGPAINPPTTGEAVQPETNTSQDFQTETNTPQDFQPETDKPEDSQLEADIPEDSQLETSTAEHSQQEENLPANSQPEESIPVHSQPETTITQHSQPKRKTPQRKTTTKFTSIPSSNILPVLKPELICVGFIGLLHNGCLYAILAYYSGYWAFALSHAIQEEKDNPSKDNYYEYGILKVTIGEAICFMILHLIGMVLTCFVLRMDHFLRYSTDPVMCCVEEAKIMQRYVLINLVFIIYSLLMFFVVLFYIPPEYKWAFIGLMLGSICLRTVCADIVERYLILLANLAGLKICHVCCFNPRRKQKVQVAPSDQV